MKTGTQQPLMRRLVIHYLQCQSSCWTILVKGPTKRDHFPTEEVTIKSYGWRYATCWPSPLLDLRRGDTADTAIGGNL